MRLLVPFVFVSVLTAIAGCSNDIPSSDVTPADDLEVRRQHIKQQEANVSDEAQARKDRSITILKAEKVPFIEHLPLIEIEAESTRRTTEQVATLRHGPLHRGRQRGRA